MVRFKALILLIILSILSVAGCNSHRRSTPPSGRVVKVGVIGPMNGTKAALGEDGIRGMKTALKMQPLLSNGDAIKLVVADDHNDPKVAVQQFKRLVTQEKVTAVLLLSTSPPALAINPLADKYRVPVIAILATHPDVAKGTRFVSQLCFDNVFQGKVAALFTRDELLDSTAAVFQDPGNAYSTSLAREFIKEFQSIDGTITNLVNITNSTDLQNVMEEIEAHGPDILYMPIDVNEVISIIEIAHEMDWNPQYMSADGLIAEVLYSKDKDDLMRVLDGLMAIDFYSSTIAPTRFGRKARRVYRSLYHQRMTSFSALALEAVKVLQNAMNRCKNPRNRICVNRMIRRTTNLKGVIGVISITPRGKVQRALVVNKIESGRIKGLVEVY